MHLFSDFRHEGFPAFGATNVEEHCHCEPFDPSSSSGQAKLRTGYSVAIHDFGLMRDAGLWPVNPQVYVVQ